MQTQIQGGSLSAYDKTDPGLAAYLDAMNEVRRLEKKLADARARADVCAAELDTRTGEARGRLGRLAGHLDVKEQSLKNQRQRGKALSSRPPRHHEQDPASGEEETG